MGHGKFYRAAAEKIDRNRSYSATDAVALLKESARPNFDESVELAMNLGVDPRHADQMVRGTVNLPHGTGRSTRVLVFAAGEKAMEATQAGADYVGTNDMIEKVSGGWVKGLRPSRPPREWNAIRRSDGREGRRPGRWDLNG